MTKYVQRSCTQTVFSTVLFIWVMSFSGSLRNYQQINKSHYEEAITKSPLNIMSLRWRCRVSLCTLQCKVRPDSLT